MPDLDLYGIPVKNKTSTNVDGFGIPIKKKAGTEDGETELKDGSNPFTNPLFFMQPASTVVAKIGDKNVNLAATAPEYIIEKDKYAINLKKKIDDKIPLTPDELSHVKNATGFDDELANLALSGDQKNFFATKTVKERANNKSTIVDYLVSQDQSAKQLNATGFYGLYENYDLEDPANVNKLFSKIEDEKKRLESKAAETNAFDEGERAISANAKENLKPGSSFMQAYDKLKDWKGMQIARNSVKDGDIDVKNVGLSIIQGTDTKKTDEYWKSHIPIIPTGSSIVDAARVLFKKDTPLQDYDLENTGATYLKRALEYEASVKALAGEDNKKDIEDFATVSQAQIDLYNKYPDVRYGQIVAAISNAKASEEGLTSDTEKSGGISRVGYTTSGEDVVRLAKENGLYDSPLDKELVDKIAGKQDVNPMLQMFIPAYGLIKKATAPIENFSLAGQFTEGVSGVVESTGKSIVDLAQLRGNTTISAEQYNDDVIKSWKKDQSGLDETQKNIALIGNTTGQVVGQALTTLAFSGVSKAAGLGKQAIENVGFWASGALSSYDDAKKSMLNITDSDAKAEAGALLIGFFNAASEKIFKDTKVFGDVFGKRVGNILNNIDEEKLYTAATRNTILKELGRDLPKWGANFVVEANKEAFEEFSTAVLQDITEAVFGDNVKFDLAKTWENARDTYVSTLIGGSLAAGRAAYTDLKLNPNASASLLHAAEAPNFYISSIENLRNQNQLSAIEANKKIQLVNTARDIHNEIVTLDGNLNDRQKAAYVSYRTTQSQLQDMAAKTQDPSLKKSLEEKITVLDEQKDKILNGLQFNEKLQPLNELFDKEQAVREAQKSVEEDSTPEAIGQLQKKKAEYAESVLNYYQNKQNENTRQNEEGQAGQSQNEKTGSEENKKEEVLSEQEQKAVDAFQNETFDGSVKNWTDVIQNKDATPAEKRLALTELHQQLTDPRSETATGIALGKAADAIYDLQPQNSAASAGAALNDEPDITVSEMLDKSGSYNGQKGIFFQDGQTVVFKPEGQNKEYELGTIDEVKDLPISDFNIANETSVVGISDAGDITVRGNEYKNNYSNPLAAINQDADGNVVSVNLETADGQKRTFRGNIAEDIAYQINLKQITKDDETRSNFEQFINEDEQAKSEIDNAGVPAASPASTTQNNEQVQREKIAPVSTNAGNTVSSQGKTNADGQKSSTESVKVNSEKVQYNGQDAIGSRERSQPEQAQARKSAKEKISDPATNASLKAANSYNASIGLPEVTPHTFKPSDPKIQGEISNTYPTLQDVNSPSYKETEVERKIFEGYKKKFPKIFEQFDIKDYKDLVKKSYGQLISEVEKQFSSLPIKVTFHEGDQNYENSAEMLDDVHNFNHLWVFKGGDDHTELGSITADKDGLTANDKFRAVHDYFGHSVEGYQFGKDGEENAWIEHSKMFSPLAQWALSSETRGQNSFVNYSGINEVPLEKIKLGSALKTEGKKTGNQEMIDEGQKLLSEANSEFTYADQKAIILPVNQTDFSAYHKDAITEVPEKLLPGAVQGPSTVASEPETKMFTKKAKRLADRIRNAELPSWLANNDPNIQANGITGNQLKNALADVVELIGDLLDKGMELEQAIEKGFSQIKKYFTDNNIAFDEQQLEEDFTGFVNNEFEIKPKSKLSADDQKEYDAAFKKKGAVLDLSERIANILIPETGETSVFKAATTFANAGYGNKKGRVTSGNVTSIPLMVQANVDFINQLISEGNDAIHQLMDHFGYNKNKGKLVKNFDMKGLQTVNHYQLANVLFGYLYEHPSSETNITPAQQTAYTNYLKKFSFELGREIGQSLNTAKIRKVITNVAADQILESTLSAAEYNAISEAEDAIVNILSGEGQITDEELAIGENLLYETEAEREIQAQQSGLLKRLMSLGLKKQKLQESISSEKSAQVVKDINAKMKKTDKDIIDIINKIKCD